MNSCLRTVPVLVLALHLISCNYIRQNMIMTVSVVSDE